MEVFWWIIAGIVCVALGAWINTAISGTWVLGAVIGLIVWLIAVCIRTGAVGDFFIFFID